MTPPRSGPASQSAAHASGRLFEDLAADGPSAVTLAEGAIVLRQFVISHIGELLEAVDAITAKAPFRHMITPGGFRMSAAMSNCGDVGWVSDPSGYRYAPADPLSGLAWPPIPLLLLTVARDAAAAGGFSSFEPDSCLINRYEPGARLTLHQDRNESDFSQPIVSVSLGLPAVFLFGGSKRKDRPRRIRLDSGDVVVWGGASRLAFHGVAPLADGVDNRTANCRINLTFRKAL